MARRAKAALNHPRHELSDLLTHSVRFSIVALLASASRVEFSFVRDQVEVSDSVLSKQVSALEQVGIVRVDKGFVGKRPRTWLSLTAAGRRTFDRHLRALRRIVEGEHLRGAAAPEADG
jgi:DNA-binding HxlR family transcriptional regulator